MANKMLIPLKSLIFCFLKHPANSEQRWVQLRDSSRGYSPVCPKASTICSALVAVAQESGGSYVLNLLCPRIRPMKSVSTGQVFSRSSGRLWKGFLCTFFPLLFPPALQLLTPSMPLLAKYWAGHHLSLLKLVLETVYLWLGLKPAW